MQEREPAPGTDAWPATARVLKGAISAIALLASAFAFSAPADLHRGLAWLQAQVETESLQTDRAAARQQAACESAVTLQRLAATSTQLTTLLARLQPAGDDASETIACWRYVRQQLGQTAPQPDLEARRVGGEGYSAYAGVTASSAIDTGWALSARLSELPASDKAVLLAWLLKTQAADGSFATAGRADLHATAVIARGLRAEVSSNSTAATIATKAASWLLSQRHPELQWFADTGVTSVVFEAIHPYSGAEPALAPGIEGWLLARQQPDGSWQGDPYVTAVALRALALTSTPPLDPTRSTLQVKFVDARTAAPVPGVLLQSASPAVSTTSDAGGVARLGNIAAAAYQFSASAPAYATVSLTVTLAAGQSVDLGTIQLLPPSNASTAVVSGTVREQGSNTPLVNVLVEVAGQGLTAMTTTDGSYLIPNVKPGAITLNAGKTGYLSAGGMGQVQAGQVLNFSPWLSRDGGGGNDCRIVGTVVEALTRQPIAGVALDLTGANTASVLTDAAGRFSIANLVSGLVTVRASKTGYDAVSAATQLACSKAGPTAVDFSPRMYAANTTPAHGNTSSVAGTVVDAATNKPIAGAQLVVTPSSGAPVNAQSGPDGTFVVAGLSSASAQLQARASGYQGATLTYVLSPLESLDVGQIRLRAPDVQQLLPDLKVLSVRRAAGGTDAQTLGLAGLVEVVVVNAGTAASTADVPVRAFDDANRSGSYERETDATLGDGTLATSLAPGQTSTVRISVAGILPFRDAPIHAVVDPLSAHADASRANNVLSTSALFIAQPVGGELEPQLKWHWQGSAVQPDSVQVESGILVGPFEDTNRDGRLNASDVPRVLFLTYTLPDSDGVLRVVDGRTGAEVRSIHRPGGHALSGYAGFAAADIDGDGVAEIFVPTLGRQLISLSPAGKVNWVSSGIAGASSQPYGGGPTVADIDGDGVPEVLYGPYVLNAATGAVRWVGTRNLNGAVFGYHSIAADLEGNGQQRVIVGPSVYRADGTLLWERRDVGSGYTAVMKLPGRPGAQIVVAAGGKVYLLDTNGATIWGPVQVGGPGGAPIVADLDGDGVPDVGVAGSSVYTAIRSDGSILWQKSVNDGSGQTGSSSFDFDGDGDADIVYADETWVYVYDGKTGAIRYTLPHSSGTAGEQTVIADVDNDGHADFLVASDVYWGGSHVGVRVFQGKGNRWLPTRPLWNQYAYSITNINDDLSVPRQPEPSWRAHNTFRLNKRIDGDPRSVADLTVGYARVVDGGSAGSTLTIRIGNAGRYKVPGGSRLAIYSADPGVAQPRAADLLATGVIASELPPGGWLDVDVPIARNLATLNALGRVWVAGNDDGTGKGSFVDFERSNDVHLVDLPVTAANLRPTVHTDKPSYTEKDQAVFTVTITNAGSFAHDALARLTVLDASGAVVETLPAGAAATVAAGAALPVASPWAVAGVLSGSYQLKADLFSPAGLSYGTATTSFTVTAGATQSALARITADRASYTALQEVHLSSRITDAASNAPLEDVQAKTEVTSAAGAPVFSRTETIGQLAPMTSRQYGYSLAAASLPAGSYSARLRLVDAAGTVLAHSTTTFTVLGADVTGVGLTGQLKAMPAAIYAGQGTQLTLQATNDSKLALADVPLTVRLLDPGANAVVATFSVTVTGWQPGQVQTFSFPWVGAGTHGQTLVAAASAQIGGKEVPLAQTNVKVLGILYTGTTAAVPDEVEAGSSSSLNYTVTNPAPVAGRMVGSLVVQTEAGQQLASWPLDLNIGSGATFGGTQLYVSGEQQQTLGLVLSQQLGTGSVVVASNSFRIVDPPVPVGVTTGARNKARLLVLVSCPPGLGTGDDAECVAQRGRAITSYFSALGYAVKTVATGEAFLAEMRCGTYNTYWVSNGSVKLQPQTIGELRESVRRGEALWMDGVHDARNHLLHTVAGVKHIGKLPAGNQVAALVEGGLYGAQSLPTMGQPERFELATGVAQGSFVLEGAQNPPVPAVISNDWGSGRSLVFAFDLAAMVTADVVQANSQLTAFVTASASHAASGTPTLTLGDVTQLGAGVTNQGSRTVSFKAEATLPAQLSSLGTTPEAELVANTDGTTKATWSFTLAAGAMQELTWRVQARQAGSFSTPLAVYSLPRAGSSAPPKLRATADMGTEVKEAADLLHAPRTKLEALQPSASSDKANLVKALDAVAAAQASGARGNHEQAVVQWLAAADAVAEIGSADTAEAKKAIALALEASTDALCIQTCGSAACQ